jgi:hypothetical protein
MGRLTSDIITAAFTVVLAMATIALVVTAIIQHYDSIDAVRATNRLVEATEQAASHNRQVAGANLVLHWREQLAGNTSIEMATDIQTHDSNYPLRVNSEGGRGGRFSGREIVAYLGYFDDMGEFARYNIIDDDLI